MECMCPLLGRTTSVVATPFSRGTWTIVRCLETGFVFLANPPTYDRLAQEFAWEATYEDEKSRRKREEPVVARISALMTSVKRNFFPRRNKFFALARAELAHHPADRPLRFLDIGCGWGHLLLDLHRQFAQLGRTIVPLGIEVSHKLAARAQQRVEPLGGSVIPENAQDGLSRLSPGSVDVVIMSSFLEHECQPLALLNKLRPVLHPHAAVLLKVPNFACWNRLLRGRRWCGFRFPDHVNYFSPQTLKQLAHRAGFIVSRQRLWDRFPLSDNMYAVWRLQAAGSTSSR